MLSGWVYCANVSLVLLLFLLFVSSSWKVSNSWFLHPLISLAAISFLLLKYCANAIMAPLYYTKQPFVVQHTLNSLFTLTNTNTFLVKFLRIDLWDRRIAWISSLRLKVLWKVVCVKFWGGIWSQEYKKSVSSLSYLCPFLFDCSCCQIYQTEFTFCSTCCGVKRLKPFKCIFG